MKYLIDTDICIFWFKGLSPVKENFHRVGFDEIGIPVISVAELYHGAYHSANPERKVAEVTDFVNRIEPILLHLSSAKIFGRIKSQLMKAGTPVDDVDLLIASIALNSGLVLVTNNTKHFDRIPDLKLENWLEG